MNNINIIYQKKYPKMSTSYSEQDTEGTNKEISPYHYRDSQAITKKLMESLVRIAIPERMENKGFFIAMAKEVAENNEVDIIITEYEDRYIAEFHFDSISTNYGLKELIEYADSITVGCADEHAVIAVIYYTHAVFRQGKRIAPENGYLL